MSSSAYHVTILIAQTKALQVPVQILRCDKSIQKQRSMWQKLPGMPGVSLIAALLKSWNSFGPEPWRGQTEFSSCFVAARWQHGGCWVSQCEPLVNHLWTTFDSYDIDPYWSILIILILCITLHIFTSFYTILQYFTSPRATWGDHFVRRSTGVVSSQC